MVKHREDRKGKKDVRSQRVTRGKLPGVVVSTETKTRYVVDGWE